MHFAKWIATMLTGPMLMLSGCTAQDPVEQAPPAVTQGMELEAALAKAFGGPLDQRLKLGENLVAVGPEQNGRRWVGYLVRQGGGVALAGQKVSLPSEGAVRLSQENGLVVVETLKAKAPQFAAFKVSPAGLEPVDYYALHAPEPAVKQGYHLIVNKRLNAMWVFRDGKLVKTYRVATGRDHGPQPTWSDYKTNFTTPVGIFKLTTFVENPSYTSLTDGHSFAGGDPKNPLGTRWMGFPVLGGNDTGGIYAIHGTSEPEKIGTWASDGCIRMRTEQVEELYAMLKGKDVTLQIVAE